MLLLEPGWGVNFEESETWSAMTDLEIGKEILGGCALVWVSVSDFRGDCPFVLTRLTSSPLVLYLFFLAQFCAIFYKSIMCTSFGGQITDTSKSMVNWQVARFHGSGRLFAISLLSVSAMGMFFVPIGELGRLALLQLDQNIVPLRNTVNWQDFCTVHVCRLLIHTYPKGVLPLSLSLFHDRLGTECLLDDESYSCCSSSSNSSF